MIHGVVLLRCRSSVGHTCLHSLHRSGLHSVSHSAMYIFDIVPARPSKVATAPSQLYGRGFREKIRYSCSSVRCPPSHRCRSIITVLLSRCCTPPWPDCDRLDPHVCTRRVPNFQAPGDTDEYYTEHAIQRTRSGVRSAFRLVNDFTLTMQHWSELSLKPYTVVSAEHEHIAYLHCNLVLLLLTGSRPTCLYKAV